MSEYSRQGVFTVRRDYNAWVADETLEDYALRYAPKSFRKWSIGRVANTAFSTASFMVLEALGATLVLHYGGINTLYAIFFSTLIIFFMSLPIAYYSAKFNVDMDLLTRGSGFGYLGSTITSLIYAAFTFIFFALEAAIMAYALAYVLGIKMVWAYLICTIVVIPIVTQGITSISKFQTITQPIWLVLLALPYIYLFHTNTSLFENILQFSGVNGGGDSFQIQKFFAALTLLMPLLAQMGEQADYLRFMPLQTNQNKTNWFFGVLIGGSGWVFLSAFKIFGGAILGYIAYRLGVKFSDSHNPNILYFIAYQQIVNKYWIVLLLTTTLIIISQLKINITNAYAGSLAWSNFFSRLTHSHPGRVVWVVFNIIIALLLMELSLLNVMDKVLGLFSNIAVPWVVCVFVDLIINKPLGLSPKGIEFRRAFLYDINPVGFFTLIITSVISILMYLGMFGETLTSFSILLSLLLPLVLSPLIAFWTKGKYYLARNTNDIDISDDHLHNCTVCSNNFESPDMASCPAYGGKICSLCCTLDVRCQDQCKSQAKISNQFQMLLSRIFPKKVVNILDAGLSHYLIVFISFGFLLCLFLGLLYYQEKTSLTFYNYESIEEIKWIYLKILIGLLLIVSVVVWWFVLTSRSRQVALQEARSQTELLIKEIESHQVTDKLLQDAILSADLANTAKSKYIMSISHELRTPLNSILGYAQILDHDKQIPVSRRSAVTTIRRSGEHLLSLIEGTLDIARIESGKLKLQLTNIRYRDLIQDIVNMFELQAFKKNLKFDFRALSYLPVIVKADSARLRQILINILGNAIKYTHSGMVLFSAKYQNEISTFTIEDTGPGIKQEDLKKIFEPFVRVGRSASENENGTGLGLTISKMLISIMGGEIDVSSIEGKGTTFTIKLYLPQIVSQNATQDFNKKIYIGYEGEKKSIMVVDNESVDRTLLTSFLNPLGFEVIEAESGEHCLLLLENYIPDMIFMDLAMPGIDGWETIRRIRNKYNNNYPIAVISANSFEANTENDLDLNKDFFFTKPVNMDELLGFIGNQLHLNWLYHDVEPSLPTISDRDFIYPDNNYLLAIQDNLNSGYWKGILNVLDEIYTLDKKYTDFVNYARILTSQFRLDELRLFLDKRLQRLN